MFTLAASESLQGVAGTGSAVTFTLTGDEKSTADAFGVLAQGQIPAVAASLYAPVGVAALVQKIFLANTTGGAVTVTLYINGTGGANQIFHSSIPANGSATFAQDGWKVLDASGALLTTFDSSGYVPNSRQVIAGSGLSGGGTLASDRTFDVNVDGSTLEIVADTLQEKDGGTTNAKLANMGAATFKMRALGAGTGPPIDGTATQAKTALAITPSDVTGLTFFATLANLSGDISTSGSGVTTLPVVNANVGSFGTATQVGTFTVNAKGQVTAASNTSIQIAESQVTNLVTDLAGKQPTGNYITSLTTDGTAAGPGAAVFTLATVNANVGSFGSATQVMTQTVNAKGLTTAAGNVTIQIAESQVTNLVTDLAGKQPTGNYITATTGDVAATGPGSVTATLATVNANVGSFGSATAVGAFTVNGKGLTTAASAVPIQIAESQVTNLVTDLAGKQATGNYITALTGPITATGPGSVASSVTANAITDAMLAQAPANTMKGNFTAALANETNGALAANRFFGRKSTGDITAYTISDAGFDFLAAADAAAETALLNAATSTLKGLLLAAEKNRISTADLWFDVVADGGIDRTGVVDGTTILQNAINTVGAAGGGTVYIPPNCSIKTSANINISNPFVTIQGGSRVTSKIIPTHATGNVFTVAAGAGPNGFVRFQTMRIQPATNNLRTAGYGIEVTSTVPNCSIQWVDILFQWSAIKASGQLCRMEDLGLRECGYGAVNGCMILFDAFTDQYVKAVVCDNGTVGPNAPMAGFSGVRITSLSSLLMADCQWIHCGTGLDVQPGVGLAVPSIYCMNTFFDQGTIGANFVSGSGSIVRNRFIGCWFSGNSTAGVVINGTAVNGLDFIGCEFYGAPSQPIGIDAQSAVEWAVRASRFAGNGTVAIRTTAGANHSFSISDNIIGNVSGVGANALGVNIQAGAYNRYQILDNRGLDTNTTVGIVDLGTTTYPSQKNVSNNMGAGQISGAAVRLIPPVTVPSLLTTEQVAITLPIAANAVSAGTTFRIRIRGQAGAAGTLTGRLKIGAAAGIGTGTVVLLATSGTLAANAWFVMDFDCTVGTPGAAAPISGGGNAVFISTAVGIATAAYTVPTIATTAPWWLTVTLAQGTAAGAVTLRHATIFVDSIN